MIYALLIIPLLTAFLLLFIRTSRSAFVFATLSSTLTFLFATILGIRAIFGAPVLGAGSIFYVDALSGMLVLLIGLVQWSATISSVPYLEVEEKEGIIGGLQTRRYFALSALFVTSMLATVVSNNLGVMWIALEATTLATALLVSFYFKKGSLEAAWKYLILCSTGISLGLLGLLLTYYAASEGGALAGIQAMNWTDIHAAAAGLSSSILKIAFIFVLIGFGTKAGLVPMHAWLPDAHSSAPSPISGMLSGVLLNAALFAVMRYKTIVDGSLHSSTWSNGILLVFGVLSVAVPAAFIITQVDYKRLLAYSSIEHMGIIVFSLGIGGVGTVAAVIHMIGHALAKSSLFFAAGSILQRFKSTKFAKVAGVAHALPYTGTLFAILILALLASPPSPLFVSEYMMVTSGIISHPILTGIVLLSLVVVFAGFIKTMMPLLFARTSEMHGNADVVVGERWNASHVAISLQLILLIAFGISLWSTSAHGAIQHIALILTQ